MLKKGSIILVEPFLFLVLPVTLSINLTRFIFATLLQNLIFTLLNQTKLKMKQSFLFLLALLLVISFSACDPDDPEPVNEEELITTLNLTFTPTAGGDAVNFSFQDLDGDGTGAPVVSTGILQANTNYTTSVELLNELESPAEDITLEIAEEDLDHQFFYITNVSGLTFEYSDMDPQGNPIGLTTICNTGDAGTGTMTVILLHEPNKTAAGVSTGDLTNAEGETDIEVTFDVQIQ